MNINTVRIFSKDLAADSRFYKEALGLQEVFGGAKMGFVGLDAGSCTLLLEDGSSEPELVGRFSGVSFTSLDIQADAERLKSLGYASHGEPAPQPWGGLLVHFDDPSGNTITLVQE